MHHYFSIVPQEHLDLTEMLCVVAVCCHKLEIMSGRYIFDSERSRSCNCATSFGHVFKEKPLPVEQCVAMLSIVIWRLAF